MSQTGGEILLEALMTQGADIVFCLPGESFLGFLSAAWARQDRLRVITSRNEGGAAYMAEDYGKLTGRTGVAFVTRGPGACNASVGVLTAWQDGTPLVLLVGQSKQGYRGREAYQEVEFRKMFGAIAKHVEEVSDPARIPEIIGRAYAIATSGQPGPVVVVFPQDVLESRAEALLAPVRQVAQAYPDPSAIKRLAALLEQAERPLAIVGGSGWTASASRNFTAFAEAWNIPVAASFRRQDLIDNESPVYAGELGTTLDPELAERLRQADLLLVAGARLSEVDTQAYSLVEVPNPRQSLVHAYPVGEELGRVYAPSLGVVTDAPAFAAALAALSPPQAKPWSEWTAAIRRQAERNRETGNCPGDLDMVEIMAELGRSLPGDAIICQGAGNYTGWVQRYYRFRHFGTQLAPINGSMGYGLPAAIAAKILHPERTVVAFAGDGCFSMNGQELATAVQEGANILILVINNGMYGTIRAHQERSFPGRTLATDLVNPDFVALAEAHGAWAGRVERTADFPAVLSCALNVGRPALVELRLSPEALSTRVMLSSLRKEGF